MKKIIFVVFLFLLVLFGFSCKKESQKEKTKENILNQEISNENLEIKQDNATSQPSITPEEKITEENIADTNQESEIKIEEPKKQENKQEKQIQTTLTINFGSRQKNLSASLKENATVYDLLQKLQSDGKLNFGAKSYSFGVLVEEIDGVKNSEKEKKYWMFYVNDKLSEVGASGKKLNNGDKVLWKYEKQ